MISRYATKIAALVACIGASLALAAVGSAAARQSTVVKVKAGEMYFKLSTSRIPRAGRVIFEIQNGGAMQHDFRIAGRQTPMIRPGGTARLAVVFKRRGRFPYACTVPGHAAAGMRGTFVVLSPH